MAHIRSAEESTANMQASVASHFPPITEVRAVAERMKSLNPDKLSIAASRAGQVRLITSNDSIKIDTTWMGLKFGDDEAMDDIQAETSKRFRVVQVDLRAFLKLVSCQLPEHEAELWIYTAACATFVFHIKSSVGTKKVSAHIMVHLPSLGSG
ncbi:hypothetical protein CBS101457_000721 [Exobasidium rhododendri]|nr:hypothetical protein CBS101457_000721 [Exobasidium rhododendri]